MSGLRLTAEELEAFRVTSDYAARAVAEVERSRDLAAIINVLRRERLDLESRHRQAIQACRDAAETAEKAMERILAMQPVVEAAERLCDDPNHLNRHMELHEAVQAWQEVKPS